MSYSSLHNHSYYSVLDGYGSPVEMMNYAQEIGLNSLAITDHGNQYGFIYFDEIKHNYPNIKMIYGVEFYECFDMKIKDKNNRYFHLLALAKNETGRIALNSLVTKGNLEGFYYKPRVSLDALRPFGKDLIVSSACLASKLSREQDYDKCIEYVEEYKSIFPHFYLELQSHSHEDQVSFNKKLLRLAEDTNTPFIITTDSHAAKKEDLEYQSYLVRIARDDETISEFYEGCYLQTEKEIHEIMDSQIGYDNVKIGLAETNKISDMIEDVNMPFQEPKLPHYPLPDGFDDDGRYLRKLIDDGWKDRGFDNMSEEDRRRRTERIDYEFSIIDSMGYSGYFIIVWDFIKYAKENNVMVGAGRGSGVASLVCYLLGITELDPIKYNLIFERFLNPERVSMPDLDIDFDDREKIIRYLSRKYGEDKVCQIINYSFITPVVAIKDATRILGFPYTVGDKISKKFILPTFEECMENNQDLLNKYSQYSEIFTIASKLYGRLRQVSCHAGGVGIVDTNIDDYMGMKLGSKNEHIIQADKKKSEDIGIIKFDILGVSTLSVIKDATKEAGLSLWDINPNNEKFMSDQNMFDILRGAKTNGVFQVESQGMKDLLLRLSPDSIEDISAILALYRPDSMDMLEDYISAKKGEHKAELWHDDMLSIVEKTYGTIIYQEQLMELVRLFSGRTMGGADIFRKAIGKKDLDLVRRESKKLRREIIENGYSEEVADKISSYLSSKGSYMFNMSHSMAYSVITLQTAFLKANYPIPFFKALLNNNKSDYSNLNKYIIDAQNFNMKISPPNINTSDRDFKISEGKILFGFEAIKGIGETLTGKILGDRLTNGSFKNMSDFRERILPSVSQVIALIKSGAIPSKSKSKEMKKYGRSLYKEKEFKILKTVPSKKILKEKWDMKFSDKITKEQKIVLYNAKRKIDFEEKQRLKFEKNIRAFENKYMDDESIWEFETLSVFLDENPFEEAHRYISPVDDVEDGQTCVVVGVISKILRKNDRHGNRFAFVNLYSSHGGLIELIVWSSQYSNFQEYISNGSKIAVLGEKQGDEKIIVQKIKSYEEWINVKRKKK